MLINKLQVSKDKQCGIGGPLFDTGCLREKYFIT